MKRAEAGRIADAPRIDGRLDDDVWLDAQWISDFVQKEPEQGAPPTQRTELAIVYDDEALYVGARMHSDNPDEIAASLTRRDEAGNGDRIVVSFDTYRDRRTAYSFAVTAAGVRLDWYHPEDDEEEQDATWNPVWEAQTALGDDGWTAELRIPFSQLRFSRAEEQVWGMNAKRYIPAHNEDDFWVVVPREASGWASHFGELRGIRGVRPSRRVEIQPYVAGDATLTSGGLVDATDPFRDWRDMGMRAGADLKIGLGPNLTLDATVNPDFGQVEADPAEVNLSAFETFFEERRPFFTEGQQKFTGNGPSYFYSRRIGAPPRGSVDGDFTQIPQTTTILGAGKLTGRLASGLSIGALGAVTDDEWAQTFDLESETLREIRVEPQTLYGAVRLEQEWGADASTVGITATAVRRGFDGDPGLLPNETPLVELLPQRAFAGGVDWNRRFGGGDFELRGHVGWSYVDGDTAAIAELQRNSSHYFQRPDADHVELDPSRTSLAGWSASLRGEKRSGRWRGVAGTWIHSPGFEINDAGQMMQADFVNPWFGVSYRQTEPGRVFRSWRVGGWNWYEWNFDGIRTETGMNLFTDLTWRNFWSSTIQFMTGFPSLNARLTRGGPLMKNRRWWRVAGELSGNPSSTTRWGMSLRTGGDELGGWLYQAGAELRTRPDDRIELSIEPRYTRREDPRQYLDTFDGGPAATFNRRYVFGRIDRSEIAAPVRANLSLSPDLSVELYAEPFASSGRFFDIGQLAAARTQDLLTFGSGGTTIDRNADGNHTITDDTDTFTLDNPDFNVLSFRSNAVLRWEWNPGSTLFLVWQQNRSRFDETGSLVDTGELWDSFSAEGDNVFALKVSYWLPI